MRLPRPTPVPSLAAAAIALSACAPGGGGGGGGGAGAEIVRIAGPGNAAALEAAARCNNDAALDIARGAAEGASPDRQLFSQFIQAALLREMGDTGGAAAAIDRAAASPAMNPEGRSRAEIAQGEAAVSQMIARQRLASTGSAGC